jgi:hypothetical protein
MAKFLMFFHIMFIFLYIFTMVIEGFPGKFFFLFLSFFDFSLYMIHSILLFINIHFLFDIAEYNHFQKCYNDNDCPKTLCLPPRVPKCIRKCCRCIDNWISSSTVIKMAISATIIDHNFAFSTFWSSSKIYLWYF